MKIPIVCSIVAALLIAAGCNRSEPAAKPAAAPPSPPPPAQASVPSLPAGHPPIDMSAQQLPPGTGADAPNPQWTVPEGWQPGKASNVRRASFVATGPEGQTVDIAVTAFPGDVGGMLMNVNRWRSQIGLTPVTSEEIGSMTSKLAVNEIEATVTDFAADKPAAGRANPQRMIVVTVPHEGVSWFFKMTGDAPLVEAQKTTFLEFVKSVKF
jgi:hypothetical protein